MIAVPASSGGRCPDKTAIKTFRACMCTSAAEIRTHQCRCLELPGEYGRSGRGACCSLRLSPAAKTASLASAGALLGSRQELFPVARRLYHPKAATVDLMAMDPSLVRRNCRPTADLNMMMNCRAGVTRSHRARTTSRPFLVFRTAWPAIVRCDYRNPISVRYRSA